MTKGRVRVKDQRVTVQQIIEVVDRQGGAIGHLMQNKQNTWGAIDQLYRKLKKAMAWPWPLGWLLMVYWERKAQAELEVWRAQQQAAAQEAALKGQEEEKNSSGNAPGNIVTPMKPILDAGGNVVSVVDPSEGGDE